MPWSPRVPWIHLVTLIQKITSNWVLPSFDHMKLSARKFTLYGNWQGEKLGDFSIGLERISWLTNGFGCDWEINFFFARLTGAIKGDVEPPSMGFIEDTWSLDVSGSVLLLDSFWVFDWANCFDEAIVRERGLKIVTFFTAVLFTFDSEVDIDWVGTMLAVSFSSDSSWLILYIDRFTLACALSVSLLSRSIPNISLYIKNNNFKMMLQTKFKKLSYQAYYMWLLHTLAPAAWPLQEWTYLRCIQYLDRVYFQRDAYWFHVVDAPHYRIYHGNCSTVWSCPAIRTAAAEAFHWRGGALRGLLISLPTYLPDQLLRSSCNWGKCFSISTSI